METDISLDEKTINHSFKPFNNYGEEECEAALAVIKSGVLSRYLGSWSSDFYGGEKVQAFERAWSTFFKVAHTVSVNSATSGLIAAVGAVGVEPGDEVIVSPWTMSASATAMMVWNAIPVFADIEKSTFNLDPESIRKNITPRTKAIMVPDIFGHAADLDAIMAIAREHNLAVIEDASQAPGAMYHGKHVGTIADIGVFSLNYHKHIHTGEGGMCVTNNPKYAERMQLIRNHAEAVVEKKGVTDLNNMIGFNFRLGEIEAAMGMEQLKKLPAIIANRQKLAQQLIESLAGLPGLRLPITQPNCSHVYYVMPFIFDSKRGISRSQIVSALQHEGLQGLVEGYANIHLLPMYQRKIAYGNQHYPWVGEHNSVSYAKGICPVAEKLQDEEYIGFMFCTYDFQEKEIALIAKAFRRVWARLGLL